MSDATPKRLGLIAGRGVYPLLLAESAHAQGVTHIHAVAFSKETEPGIRRLADTVDWVRMGQLGRLLDALAGADLQYAVMAGQLSPKHLFHTRLDAKTRDLLKRLPIRNAQTIFRAVADELKAIGIELLPAHSFMSTHMPGAGLLTRRAPTPREDTDIALGFTAARTTSALDIGQTVVVKEGTIVAVEAFEGTDRTLRRAGRLAGPGAVVVKVAKAEHDMRFDIPVIGMRTMKALRRAGVSALAVEAGRCILLERQKVIQEADRIGLAMVAVDPQEPLTATGAAAEDGSAELRPPGDTGISSKLEGETPSSRADTSL